jgi:hypothetical protein
VTFSLNWRTDTVVALAAQMYEARDFSAMPIMADALQEVPSARREGIAGCDNADLLGHCREELTVRDRANIEKVDAEPLQEEQSGTPSATPASAPRVQSRGGMPA